MKDTKHWIATARKECVCLLAAGIALFGALSSVLATDDVLWTGLGADDNWSTADNWTNKTVGTVAEPEYYDNVFIGRSTYVDLPVTCVVDRLEEDMKTVYIECKDGETELNIYTNLTARNLQMVYSVDTSPGFATVNQSGGYVQLVYLNMGFEGANATAIYNLTGGELRVTDRLNISSHKATSGDAYFNIGDADGTGLISGSPQNGMYLNHPDGPHDVEAQLLGWGPITIDTFLDNNGRVIAKGYGQERTLSMTDFASVTNTLDNNPADPTDSNGWYAVDYGKLSLPPIEITATGTYNWGEADSDTSIDLVNSLSLDVTNLTTAGNVSIDLLAPERSELTPAEVNPSGKMIGAWSFDPGTFEGSVDLTVRYDHAAASAQGITEDQLKIFAGTPLAELTTEVDTINKTVTATGVDSFDLFAVGVKLLPPAGTSISIR